MSDSIYPDLASVEDWLNAKGYTGEAGACHAAMSLIRKQEARIAELKAALKPFADKATVYPDLPDNWLAHVTMKHLRAARAAYLGDKND